MPPNVTPDDARIKRFAGCVHLMDARQMVLAVLARQAIIEGIESGERMTGTRWRLVWASLVALTLSSTPIVFYTQSLFLGPMTQAFGWSRSGYFSAVLAGGVAGAIATPVIGRLLDRVGVRPVLFAGIALFALLNAALGLIGGSLPAYIALSALVAVAGVVQGPLSYAKAITGWFDRRRGVALAVALSGTGLGGVFVPPLTAWLIAEYGWRGARFGLGALVLVVALPIAIAFVREAQATPSASQDAAEPVAQEGVTLRAALATPTMWLLVFAFLLSSIVVNGTLANLAAMIGGHGAPIAAIALSALAGGQIAGRLASGWLLDRVLTARIGAVWYVSAIVGLALLGTQTATPLVLLGSVLVGAGVGAELEMAAVFTSRFFGRRHFGAINGAIFSAYLIGAAAGPLISSTLVTVDGSYARAIVAGVIALAVAAGLLFSTGRYRYLPTGS